MKKVMLTVIMGAVLISMLVVAVNGAPLKIGICKIVEHPALDAVQQGTIDALTAAGIIEGEDVVYLISSAQGDPNNAIPISQNYKSQDVDLVVAISTPMAMAAAEVFKDSDTPIIFCAVTDPVDAGLVLSATDPSQNANVTGVSDLIDVLSDLELLKSLSPSIQRIGMVYNPGEANSDRLTSLAAEKAPEIGLQVITAIADNTANVPIAAQSLIGRVDAFYVTTDNTVVSAIDSVVAAAEEAGVPFLMADPTSLKFGPVLATGFDYYRHGLIAGEIVAEVLGGKAPNEIPVTYQTGAQVFLNLDAAANIGLDFAPELIAKAAGIYFADTLWTKESE
jgi:putative tryptophan/tyrosine transport system substrate-binding protein